MTKQLLSSNNTLWDDAYSIGHEKIDSEHKRLFEIASEINKYSNDSEMIIKIVKELVRYTKFHFKNEEDFMRSICFENLEEHKKIHRDIVENLSMIIKNINSQPLEKIVEQLNIFINKNILQHILIEDKKVHHAIRTREELKEHFRWRIVYELKNELLDDEHKQLFDIGLKALAYNDTDIKKHIKLTINELYDYMKTHFEHEEKFMKEINYPNIEEHILFHKNIIDQVNEFIKQLSTLKIVDFERKLIEYMDIWLINHIIYEDRKIIDFYQK